MIEIRFGVRVKTSRGLGLGGWGAFISGWRPNRSAGLLRCRRYAGVMQVICDLSLRLNLAWGAVGRGLSGYPGGLLGLGRGRL